MNMCIRHPRKIKPHQLSRPAKAESSSWACECFLRNCPNGNIIISTGDGWYGVSGQDDDMDDDDDDDAKMRTRTRSLR
jgi:hypothetical protein